MKFLRIWSLKVLFILSCLFLVNSSNGKDFYETLLQNHRLSLTKYFEDESFYKELLFKFSSLSLSDLEDRYVGYSEIIKLLKDTNSRNRATRKTARKKMDEILFKINSSSDQSSIELVRIFVGVLLFSTWQDLSVWNSAAAFLSRIQNYKIMFFEVEQELISILFSSRADVQLRIAVAKTLGKIRPKHPYIPDQLIEALYRSWVKANYKLSYRGEYRVVAAIAKALVKINPEKLIEALYYTNKTKPDTVESNVITFPPPVDPSKEENHEALVQFLKSKLLEVTSDQPESKPTTKLSTRESKIRYAVEYALKKIQSDNPAIYYPLVNNLIFSEDFNMRKQAADILIYVNPQRMVSALHVALSHSKKDIRMGGIRAVREIRIYLLSYLDNFFNHQDYLNFLNTHGLKEILDGDFKKVSWSDFFSNLSHSNIQVRMAALMVFFERIISQQLIDSLSHSDADIRDRAITALNEINPEKMTEALNQFQIRRGISRKVIFRCYNGFSTKSAVGR